MVPVWVCFDNLFWQFWWCELGIESELQTETAANFVQFLLLNPKKENRPSPAINQGMRCSMEWWWVERCSVNAQRDGAQRNGWRLKFVWIVEKFQFKPTKSAKGLLIGLFDALFSSSPPKCFPPSEISSLEDSPPVLADALQGYTSIGFGWAPLGSIGLHWLLLASIRFYWVSLDYIVSYRCPRFLRWTTLN